MSFGPSSSSTVLVDPDSLPMKGYTKEALSQYVLRSLGAPTWEVELTTQQVYDSINDSLALYSQWVPNERAGSIILTRGRFAYLQGVDVDQGVSRVEFVERNPVPLEGVFFGNLMQQSPIFRVGLDEYDTFMRWRKTWQRVMSVRPDWYYDEGSQTLFIHNPIERYQAGVFIFTSFTNTVGLSLSGAQWVKEYALESCRYKLGEIWMKYSGAIPGPLQNLQLDQQKRDKAETRLKELRDKLQGMQRSTQISVD